VGESIIEQAMVLCTAEGIIAVTGCAHPGVVAMVQAAKEVFDTPVECVLGGFHLTDTPPAGVQAIIRQLRDLGVTTVGPCHCTGDAAIAHFSDEYGEDSLPVRAGWHRSFEPCS
jgi:7,8-dihydropterin-6-yl-methyl-4-(beta-D-ribofuranosyl)aminobenzene 5'-phosphate synthase